MERTAHLKAGHPGWLLFNLLGAPGCGSCSAGSGCAGRWELPARSSWKALGAAEENLCLFSPPIPSLPCLFSMLAAAAWICGLTRCTCLATGLSSASPVGWGTFASTLSVFNTGIGYCNVVPFAFGSEQGASRWETAICKRFVLSVLLPKPAVPLVPSTSAVHTVTCTELYVLYVPRRTDLPLLGK